MISNLLIDIDGTICNDIPNEESHRYPDAQPIKGAKERINKLIEEGHIITFFTAREEKDREVTIQWLRKYGFSFSKLIMDKPRGGNYRWIDNHIVKGILFEGSWENLEV